MSYRRESILVRALERVADAVLRRPAWFLWPQFLLFAACVWFSTARLGFNMDRNALVGADKQYHRNYLALKREFPEQDDLVCVVESGDHEKNRQFVERLGQRLEAESTTASPTNLFTDVLYKGDLKMLGPKALLFVPETNLIELRKALEDFRPFITQFSAASNLDGLFGRVNRLIRSSGRDENEQTDSLLKAIPALEGILRRAADSIDQPGTPPSPGVDSLFGGGEEAEREKYVTFARGRIYLATAKARLDELNPDAVDRFRQLVDATRLEAPGVNVGVTGEPVLEYDEMRQSQVDSTKASVVSLALCAAIFVLSYRGWERPGKAVIALIVGLGYTLGYTTLVVGHLNILTITFVPMLIGLAIDFGVHLITRYEEEVRRGETLTEAMRRAMVNTGQGVVTACLTTAGAFLAMALTDFKGIQEMGLITGGGMILCLAPMMTLLPTLLLRGPQNARDEAGAATVAGPTDVAGRSRLESWLLRRPWTVLGAAAALTVVAAIRAPRVRFDYNLLHMQSPGLAAVVFEDKLIQSSEKSVLYGAVVASNVDEAVTLERKLMRLPSVSSVDSMAHFMAESPESKLALVREIKKDLASVSFAGPDSSPANLTELDRTLWSERGLFLSAADEVEKAGETNLLASIHSLTDAIQRLRAAMSGDDARRSRAAVQIGRFQQALFADLRETFASLRSQDDRGGLRAEDLPEALRHRFIGVSGKHLLQVYPKVDVWERGPQEEFVKELQSVAPAATGTPVQLYYYTELLRSSYVVAAWWSLGAIIILVWFQFRKLGSVGLALLPVGLGAVWVVGFMGWTDIPFNPANIMMLPLVIGIGVTNGIHILTRHREEGHAALLGKSTGKAVLVSGLNTMAGFGSLILADHRGIRSLGWIMATGTAACMIAALTVLPAWLTLSARRRAGGSPTVKTLGPAPVAAGGAA